MFFEGNLKFKESSGQIYGKSRRHMVSGVVFSCPSKLEDWDREDVEGVS